MHAIFLVRLDVFLVPQSVRPLMFTGHASSVLIPCGVWYMLHLVATTERLWQPLPAAWD